MSRKGSPCQNAILWTLLFTPHARRVNRHSGTLSCLLYGEGTGQGHGGTGGYLGVMIGLISWALMGIGWLLLHVHPPIQSITIKSETNGSILVSCLSSCYSGLCRFQEAVISQGNKQTDRSSMCSQGPGTGAQFLFGGTSGCSSK